MKILCTIALLVAFLSLGAQEYPYQDRSVPENPPDREEITTPGVIARLNFVLPSFILEFGPAEHFCFTTGLSLWPGFWQEDNATGESYFRPAVSPTFYLEPRFFFNQKYRSARGRRTDHYSGWYVGIPFRMEFPDFRFTMGTTMGFQRTFGRRWFWTAGIGPGAYYKEGQFRIRPVVDTGFGLILN